MSGADLAYQEMLTRAGKTLVPNGHLDGAILSQLALDPVNVNSWQRTRKVALLGDSISNQNTVLPYTDQAVGYFAWANVLNRHAFDMSLYSSTQASFGGSGQTTSNLLTNGSIEAVCSSDADIVIVQIGTNDIGQNVIPSAIMANTQKLWNKLLAANKTVIATTILPRNNGDSPTSTMIQNLRDTNRLIRIAAANTPGVYLCDWYQSLIDITTGNAKAAYLLDGIHPNVAGASRMGSILAKVLAPLAPVGAFDDLPMDNSDTKELLPNPFLTGTGGAISGANLTGAIAASCTAYQIGTPTSIVASKVARTDLSPGEWQQFVCTAVDPKTDGVQLQQQNTAVGVDWNVGDTVYSTMEFETDAANFDCRQFQSSLFFFNITGGADIGFSGTDMSNSSVSVFRPVSGIFKTRAVQIPVGTTRLQINSYFRGSGTIRFGRCQVVRVP